MKDIIEAAFEDRANLNPDSATKEVKDAVNEAIYLLDSGKARVAERQGVGDWRVNEWLKKAVLLSFRLEDNTPLSGGFTQYYDKVPSKFANTSSEEFEAAGVRVVPPATARRGSYIAKNTVLMPKLSICFSIIFIWSMVTVSISRLFGPDVFRILPV